MHGHMIFAEEDVEDLGRFPVVHVAPSLARFPDRQVERLHRRVVVRKDATVARVLADATERFSEVADGV